jgi:histidinol-phosphate aminotransferase
MGSPIRNSVRAMTGYVPGEQPSDPAIIKLNTNENPYPPSGAVVRVLESMDLDLLRKYPDPLCAELRSKIAEIHGCDAGNVFVANGSDEILALCTRAFVENDGAIGYLDPSYSLYPVLADIRDVSKQPVTLGDDFAWPFGSSGVDVPTDSSLFFVANPNAPTGILYPKAMISEFSNSYNGVLVVDEAYVDFACEHCMDLALALDNVLVMRTLSKSFSLAGLRLGYVVGSKQLIDALVKIKDSYNVGTLVQRVALAALSDLEAMQGNVKRIQATRERLSSELQDMGCKVFPSEANFVWVCPAVLPAKELFEQLKKRRILIRYFESDLTKGYVRITVGTDEEIDRLLEAMKEVLNEAQNSDVAKKD